MGGILRTPEERFADLPGYPFAPRYLGDVPGFEGAGGPVRMHYLDEGPRDGLAYLLLHGHPTWSYLYRRLVPEIVAAGHRAVAPDLPGFGRSDKPADPDAYTFEGLRAALLALVERLDLSEVVLVVHEWGGTLGLTLPPERPARFAGLVCFNTWLATGERPLADGYRNWIATASAEEDLNVRALMARTNRILTLGECNAYHAPFPDAAHKAALRALPRIMPQGPGDPGAERSRAAGAWWGEEFDGVASMLVGMRDPLVPPDLMRPLAAGIRGLAAPVGVGGAGHFVPEWADEFGADLVAEIDALRAARAAAGKEGEPTDGAA